MLVVKPRDQARSFRSRPRRHGRRSSKRIHELTQPQALDAAGARY